MLAAEHGHDDLAFVCAFGGADGARSWLVFDAHGRVVTDRRTARDAVAVAALCEIAAEMAFPGDLDELRAQLVALRLTEAPDGIEEAEAAAGALQRVIGAPPSLASPARLDELGQATRRLERALDPTAASAFIASMRSAQTTADALWHEVEAGYRAPFND